MSTTYLSIGDLLRIAYTYESQAAMQEHAQSQQGLSRSNSQTSICSTPDHCLHASMPMSSSTNHAALETDFTDMYARRKRDSCVSMT